MFWDRILQIPERRATATNNQELPRTFRNLDSEIALSQFGVLQNASNCNKRMHQNANAPKWGAAVLAPLGAIGSAAPLRSRGAWRAKHLSAVFCRPWQYSRASTGRASAADPAPKIMRPLFFAAFFAKFPHFLPTFCRSKIRRTPPGCAVRLRSQNQGLA